MESIGQTIKKLRKERNLTQEELSERLGVTPQAVSKWENNAGMPDISQVIPLASALDVPTDVLFGLKNGGADAAIAEVKKSSAYSETDNNKRIELWSDLLRHYPCNNKCRFFLAHAYLCRQQDGDFATAAELYEKILAESTDSKLRLKTLGLLCFSYNRMGDTANAVRVAKLCGPSHITADSLLAKIDGYEKHNECNQNLLAYSVEESAWCLFRQTYKTDADAIFAYRTALSILDLIYYTGDKSRVSTVYAEIRAELCKLLAKAEEYDALYSELERWLKDTANFLHFKNCRYPNNIFLKQNRGKISQPERELEYILHCLSLSEYDNVRHSEHFKAFLTKVQNMSSELNSSLS